MLRRVLVFVAIAALLVAAVGGVAVAKKKRIQPGNYPGTTNEGIPMSVTLAKNRASGTFTYCEAAGVPFSVVGGRSFQVFTQNPDGTIQISGGGTFSKNGTVSGTIDLGGGCSGSAQTFFLKRR
jgi:hypothetical protein